MMEIKSAEFITSMADYGDFTGKGLPQIAVAGKSNVGKSTLINRLCRRNKLARTSSTPGKTRLLNVFLLNEEFHLVDLPGYGFARRSGQELERWSSLMEAYFGTDRNIELALILMDSRHDPTEDDYDMISYMNRFGIEYWAVLTKTDKLNKTELSQRLDAFEELIEPLSCSGIVPFTIRNEESAENLRKMLSDRLEG